MLSYKTIEPHTLELLKKLTPESFLAKARLVGGTALALQYGHRMSIDLAMKINAIEGRGTKKDFIDMYFLLQHYTLDDILKFYAEKYPENSIFRGLMSLSYFEDAEDELMPKMFSNIQWDDMKQFILDKVATIR